MEQGGDAECQPGRQRQTGSLRYAVLIEAEPAGKSGQKVVPSLLWMLDDQSSSWMR